MYKFGVCWYDEYLIYYDNDNDVEHILAIYDTHREAYRKYLDIIKDYGYAPSDLWIIWIDEENKIIQFEKAERKTFSRIRGVNSDKV